MSTVPPEKEPFLPISQVCWASPRPGEDTLAGGLGVGGGKFPFWKAKHNYSIDQPVAYQLYHRAILSANPLL